MDESKDIKQVLRDIQYEIRHNGHLIANEAFWSLFINSASFVVLLLILWRI